MVPTSPPGPLPRLPPRTSDRGQTEKAVDAARQTLEPTLAQLPDELEAAIQGACEAWDRGEPEKARRLVGDAVTLARELLIRMRHTCPLATLLGLRDDAKVFPFRVCVDIAPRRP